MAVLPSWFRAYGLPLVLSAAAAALSCGKKGPPLAPLRLVPGPASEVTARRVGREVQLRFKLPTANQNGPGSVDLARVEVYAVTVAPGTVTPANRDLMTKTYVVGTIDVKPPPVEGTGEQADNAPADTRPGPGDEVTFVEELTEARMTPAPLPKTPPPAVPAPSPDSAAAALPALPEPGTAILAGTPVPIGDATVPAAVADLGPPGSTALPAVPALPEPGTAMPAGTPMPIGDATPGGPGSAAAPAKEPPQTVIVRTYTIRGFAKSGRPGQPSTRVTVPLVAPPPPPADAKASFTEKAVVLAWTPPVAEGAGSALTFNVYRGDATRPLNASPLTAPTLEIPGLEVGTEHCFAIRTAAAVQKITIEGDATHPVCVTPRDIFPPAAPQELSLLLLDGAIELVWDAGTEPDIAGYIVLRADAPGDNLRALTPSPVRETTYRDASVRSGGRYVYAVTAVDRTGNASPQSARVEGTAR